MTKLRSEDEFRVRLAREVRRLRRSKDWSQADLAGRLPGGAGSRLGWVKRLELAESGDGVPTTLGSLEEIARAFGMTTYDLCARLLRVRRGEPDKSADGRGRWLGQPYFEEVRSLEAAEDEWRATMDRLGRSLAANEAANLEAQLPLVRRIFASTSRLATAGEANALSCAGDMLDGLTRARGLGDTLIGVPIGSPPTPGTLLAQRLVKAQRGQEAEPG